MSEEVENGEEERKYNNYTIGASDVNPGSQRYQARESRLKKGKDFNASISQQEV